MNTSWSRHSAYDMKATGFTYAWLGSRFNDLSMFCFVLCPFIMTFWLHQTRSYVARPSETSHHIFGLRSYRESKYSSDNVRFHWSHTFIVYVIFNHDCNNENTTVWYFIWAWYHLGTPFSKVKYNKCNPIETKYWSNSIRIMPPDVMNIITQNTPAPLKLVANIYYLK